MNGKTHTISQTNQAKFGTDAFSIGIDDKCSVIMSRSKKDFVGDIKKGLRVINIFEDP